MNDRPERSARGPVPWGVIGLLFAVVVIERGLSRHERSFADPAAMNFQYCKGVSATKAAHAEILALGTSMMKLGVVPRVIATETGRSVFNLAVLNGHLPSSYFVLRRALENGARPKAILLDCQDSSIPPEKEHERFEGITANRRNWPELLDTRDTLDLAWVAGDSEFLADTLISRVLTSCKDRYEIRGQVLGALRGEKSTVALMNRALLRNWRVNQGAFMISANVPSNVAPAALTTPSSSPADTSTASRSNRLTEAYLGRVLDLAAAYQFRVFWVLPPLPPATQATREAGGQDDYFTALANRVRARCPKSVVIDARRSGYPADLFVDAVHLSAQGATTFSAEIAKVVKAELDHPSSAESWVNLAPYRQVAPMQPYEDLSRSQVTVNVAEEHRRR